MYIFSRNRNRFLAHALGSGSKLSNFRSSKDIECMGNRYFKDLTEGRYKEAFFKLLGVLSFYGHGAYMSQANSCYIYYGS